jgi:hypothetical protein
MALIGQTLPSLLDVYSRTDKNGRIAKIVEQLAKSNDVITDAIYVPCNDGSKHKTTIRAGVAPLQPGRAAYQNPDRSGD